VYISASPAPEQCV